MSGHYTLEGKNGIIALDMLKKITNLLDTKKIDYWLEGGTLLGIVREDRLLPWDNDMDISITEEYYEKILESINDIKKLGYIVWVKEFNSDNEPFKEGITRIIKIRNRKFYFIRGEVALDIFIMFKKDEQYYWQIKDQRMSVPAHFYDELKKYTFNKKEYLIPKDVEEYLTYRYGEWKTPVKEWDTVKDDLAAVRVNL